MVLWLLISIIVILGLAYWVTRHLVGGAAFGGLGIGKADRRMKVLARLPLGKSEMLVVAQVGGQCYLLGVTAGGITLLAELTEEEAAGWKEPADAHEAGERPDFRQVFSTVLRQKERR